MATSTGDGDGLPQDVAGSFATAKTDHEDREQRAVPDSSVTNATANQAEGVRSPASSTSAQDAITQLLRFLAGASNEMLCAIAAGLAALTYAVLGRLGLMLMGILGGIVLHATWEDQSGRGDAEGHRKERGHDVLARVLGWRETKQLSATAESKEQYDEAQSLEEGFNDFRPATAAALNELVDATIRDYVDYWYAPILPEERSFPQSCRQTFVSFLRSISRVLSKKRPEDAFLGILTNTSSIVIVFLSELSNAIMAAPDSEISPQQAVADYLSSHPDSNLGHIMDEKQQRKKFQLIADDLLQTSIDKSVYSCEPARIFSQQMLGSVVMEMSLKACSRPEWLNGWIIYLLEEGEPDLIQAIDAGIEMPSLNTTAERSTDAQSNNQEQSGHMKRVSNAEEAMQSAIDEAKRLSQLIVEDDLKRAKDSPGAAPDRPSAPSQVETEAAAPSAVTTSSAITNSAQESVSSSNGHHKGKASFTSFDQVSPQFIDTEQLTTPPPLTLHNASITILEDESPKSVVRSKPMGDYLVQIEPHSSRHPGWMIVRKYSDFETLHEILKRIAQVSGASEFTESHGTVPTWKQRTKAGLRVELEDYLRDACRYQPLADSVGLKRFLEKENQGPTEKNGWPMGKGGKALVENIRNASKGATEGGKSVFGGMTGVLANIGSGHNRKSESKIDLSAQASERKSSDWSQLGSNGAKNEYPPSRSETLSRPSVEETLGSTQNLSVESMDRTNGDVFSRVSSDRRSDTTSGDDNAGRSAKVSADLDSVVSGPSRSSDMSDAQRKQLEATIRPTQLENETAKPAASASGASPKSPEKSTANLASTESGATPEKPNKEQSSFTEEETRVVIELIFAMINELYTLSSAWNIRRTILTAAKTFLLRPGNPSLASIRILIQKSIISSNISDEGMAAHLKRLRENTMPTEEELKAWPEQASPEEKEKLRVRARKLLVERGVPPALTGVMGQVATAEAVGKVFDCLQDEKVARGLMFGLLLQGIRIITI